MLESFLFKLWYERPKLKWLLWPLHLPFRALVSFRRLYFQVFVKATPVKVPIIVIGNLNIGGSGKTPFTTSLVELIRRETDCKTAILSRGYGANPESFPHLINESDSARSVGDEPWMMFRRLDIPVVIDPDRYRGAKWIAENLDVDFILCDDGLQHYHLTRQYEILVYDGNRRFGNGLVMPLGPLREPVSRAAAADVQVEMVAPGKQPVENRFYCQLDISELRCVANDQPFKGEIDSLENAVAVCGIADPEKFFRSLTQIIRYQRAIPFPDHYQFREQDFEDFAEQPVIMTEKDAVKCQAFAKNNWYYLPLKGSISAPLEEKLLSDVKQLVLESNHEQRST